MKTIKLSGVTKAFGEFSLKIDNLEMQTQKMYGIIGSNGCGKTTLMKIIAGLEKPDTGSVSHDLKPQDITMVFRKPYLMNETVEKNLYYPFKIRGIKPNKDKLDYYLDIAGLADQKSKNAKSLSGGAAQKLALIRAIAFSPRLVLLDEGFSNMDIESVSVFENLILEHQRETRSTWFVISHQLSNIKRLCSEVYFMSKGEILLNDKTEEIFERPKIPELKKFLMYS